MNKFLGMLKKAYAYIWLVVGYTIDVLFMALKGKRFLDSDMASEMILSDILNKEHSIIGLTNSWYYSTEIRFMEMQYFYRIGLLFSPNNWHVARVIAMAIALAFLAFCVCLLFRAVEMNEYAVLAAAICLFPGGSYYFWLSLFGGYYLPYIYFSILTAAFTIYAVKNAGRKRCWYYIAAIVILGVSAGLNGVRQLSIFYLPFVLSNFVWVIYAIREDGGTGKTYGDIKSMREFRCLLISGVSLLSAIIGYLINSKVLSKYYNFAQFNDQEINGNSILDMARDYIWSFGYAEGKTLISMRGIAVMCGVAIGIISLVCGIRLMIRLSELGFFERFLALFSFISVAFCIFSFAYVSGSIKYMQPILPMGLFLILLDIVTEKYSVVHGKEIVLNLFVIMFFVSSLGTVRNEFNEPFHPDFIQKDIGQMVGFVENYGYSTGVGRFWLSNVMTELSDGRIDMWTINGYDSDDMYEWLQKSDHIGNFPDGKYFFITYPGDSYQEFLERHPELELIYGDDRYLVYGN